MRVQHMHMQIWCVRRWAVITAAVAYWLTFNLVRVYRIVSQRPLISYYMAESDRGVCKRRNQTSRNCRINRIASTVTNTNGQNLIRSQHTKANQKSKLQFFFMYYNHRMIHAVWLERVWIPVQNNFIKHKSLLSRPINTFLRTTSEYAQKK